MRKILYMVIPICLFFGCNNGQPNRHIYEAKLISNNQRIVWKPLYNDDIIDFLPNDTVVYYDWGYDKNGKTIVVDKPAIIVSKIH